jgi:CheY-like chemotaxis protein
MTITNNNNNSNTKKILIIDDDSDINYLFKTILECNGYVVEAFTEPLTLYSTLEKINII